MPVNHLQKITTRAKQLRKASPKMAWQMAIKKAAAELKKVTKVSGVKKRTPAKKAAVKKVTIKAKSVRIGTTKMSHCYEVSKRMSGVTMQEMSRQQSYLMGLEKMLMSTNTMLTDPVYKKKLTAGEMADLRRQKVKQQKQIATVKKHIQAMKKHL